MPDLLFQTLPNIQTAKPAFPGLPKSVISGVEGGGDARRVHECTETGE